MFGGGYNPNPTARTEDTKAPVPMDTSAHVPMDTSAQGNAATSARVRLVLYVAPEVKAELRRQWRAAVAAGEDGATMSAIAARILAAALLG